MTTSSGTATQRAARVDVPRTEAGTSPSSPAAIPAIASSLSVAITSCHPTDSGCHGVGPIGIPVVRDTAQTTATSRFAAPPISSTRRFSECWNTRPPQIACAGARIVKNTP